VIGGDTNRMTAAERVTELGQIFFTAIQRLLVREVQARSSGSNCSVPLALDGGSGAQCARSTEDAQ